MSIQNQDQKQLQTLLKEAAQNWGASLVGFCQLNPAPLVSQKNLSYAISIAVKLPALTDKTKPREYGCRLMRRNAAIGIIFPKALTGGNRERGIAVFFDKVAQTQGDLIEKCVRRTIILEVHKGRRTIDGLQHCIGQFDCDRDGV